MKIGITGTRSGCTPRQIGILKGILWSIIKEYPESEFHHGDCVGVDVEAACIAKELGYKVINHPPVYDHLRAFHQSDEIRDPLSYFARNRNIVDETDMLIVIPYQMEWQPNGGTWYTHDYAKKKQKQIHLILPEEPNDLPNII